jgi:neutral amino acid transport system ATP-binding protein
MLEINDLRMSFGVVQALDGVSLVAEAGLITGLIGPNGSGKSTLINVVSGFYRGNSGQILFRGEDITGLDSFEIARRGLMRTFQVSKAPPKLTVLENLLLASSRQTGEQLLPNFLRHRNVVRQEKEDLLRAHEIAEIIRLKELKNEYAATLSGGQKKLLSLGRMLMCESKLILLDEPTAGVNPTLTAELVEVVRDIREQGNSSFLIVEHNMKVIFDLCDDIYVLNVGTNLARGTPREIQQNDAVLEAYLSGSR